MVQLIRVTGFLFFSFRPHSPIILTFLIYLYFVIGKEINEDLRLNVENIALAVRIINKKTQE